MTPTMIKRLRAAEAGRPSAIPLPKAERDALVAEALRRPMPDLSQIQGIEVQEPETNLVFFKPDGAGASGNAMVGALRQRGVMLAMMDGRIRACTHFDVTAAMIEETVGLVREIVRKA